MEYSGSSRLLCKFNAIYREGFGDIRRGGGEARETRLFLVFGTCLRLVLVLNGHFWTELATYQVDDAGSSFGQRFSGGQNEFYTRHRRVKMPIQIAENFENCEFEH